jgi:hypothetical protein
VQRYGKDTPSDPNLANPKPIRPAELLPDPRTRLVNAVRRMVETAHADEKHPETEVLPEVKESGFSSRGGNRGQAEIKCRPFVHLCFDPNLATMALNDSLHY